MSNSPNHLVVAKFGGTSMARPDLVGRRISEHQPNTVVVSAPGKSPDYKTKITDHLVDYAANPSLPSEHQITRRLAGVAGRVIAPYDARSFASTAIDTLHTAMENGDSIPALGEQWSAQLLASATGREYVDAREIIHFTEPRLLDSNNTESAIRDRLSRNGRYIVPGFYGALPDGRTTTFERGGSDITGAIIARAVNADVYQNWSDVAGYYSTNPREYADAQQVRELSYRESRELANGGSELLHPEVARVLGTTGVQTALFSTFTGQSGSRISSERLDWEHAPVIGISGRRDMIELQLGQFGIEEDAGTTADLYDQLRDSNIPYRHAATTVDHLALYLDDTHRDALQEITDGRPDLSLSDISMLHVVGEGMRYKKASIMGGMLGTLAAHSIELKGMTDIGGTSTATIFVQRCDYIKSLALLHKHIIET